VLDCLTASRNSGNLSGDKVSGDGSGPVSRSTSDDDPPDSDAGFSIGGMKGKSDARHSTALGSSLARAASLAIPPGSITVSARALAAGFERSTVFIRIVRIVSASQ